MTAAPSTSARRAQLLARRFRGGVPTLWCPLLTHYDRDGGLDRQRMTAHLTHLAPWVKGFLIPGSTGDGWEMDDREIRHLLDCALDLATQLRLHVLIGVLKTNATEARQSVSDTLDWLNTRAGVADSDTGLAQARVCGFTICPPRGKDLSQDEISRGLESVLELGLPTALYQLPQVTQNEMSPELVAGLARRFENFFLFKDTSGADRVAASGQNFEGVFLVRGAEGDYARWLAVGGGPYHGWLLSSANCFARELRQIAEHLDAGRTEKARQISTQISAVVSEVFRLVSDLRGGNPFANANKAIDHFFAHGPRAATAPPPRLHSGPSLPAAVIQATGETLARHGLLPTKGYLD